MASIGETVKYGAYGECKIIDRREEFLAGSRREYFILQQKTNSASTIYVPVEKSDAFKEVKKALTAAEIKELSSCGTDAVDWNADDKARDLFFKKAFERCDIKEIASIIKSILARQDQLKSIKKKMRATDLNAMKVCEKILYDEFSRSLDIKIEEVVPIISGTAEPREKA